MGKYLERALYIADTRKDDDYLERAFAQETIMKIETNDGARFSGRNAKAVVRAMKHDQWSAPETKGEYMEQVSDTVMNMYQAVVRIDNAENFLDDLASAGLIKFL